jgi:hypothetical protein
MCLLIAADIYSSTNIEKEGGAASRHKCKPDFIFLEGLWGKKVYKRGTADCSRMLDEIEWIGKIATPRELRVSDLQSSQVSQCQHEGEK